MVILLDIVCGGGDEVMGSYTKEQLELMSPAEICEIAMELDIINVDDLIQDILTLTE